VPAEVRPVFVKAASVAFAAFATFGLFSASAPAFLAELLRLHSHALVGVVVFSMFAAASVGQLALGPLGEMRALTAGCAAMIAGMGLVALGLSASSLALLSSGAVVAGFGNGLSFRAGLAAIHLESPAEHRGEIDSSFFVVSYIALSVPIVGVGVAAEAIGLRTAALAFAAVVAAIAAGVLISVRVRADAHRTHGARRIRRSRVGRATPEA
jgi:hypothetical protein